MRSLLLLAHSDFDIDDFTNLYHFMIFQHFCFDLQIVNACHLIVDYIIYREVIIEEAWLKYCGQNLKVSESSMNA